jgi:hypothetical protein
MSLRGFKGIEKYSKKTVPESGTAQLHKVSIAAFAAMILRSPVDTGRFRGNWKGSVGQPNLNREQEVSQEVSLGSPPTSLEMSNIQPGLQAKLGEDVYIANNLNYAEGLENGKSPQAPGGVLHVTAREIQGKLNTRNQKI